MQSKSGQPLGRYFPDVVAALSSLPARDFVLDGEIVISVNGQLSFDELLARIHPAASRVATLAAAHPAMYLVFDLLGEGRDSYLEDALEERRARLEKFAAHNLPAQQTIRISPATPDIKAARQWFRASGGALDGIVAKRLDLPYQLGNREGMQKVKQVRTCDCVVGGFRYAEKRKVIGSLLLGLYDKQGLLNHVGFTASFKESEREALTRRVERLIAPPGFTGRAPGGPSRWSTRRSDEWQPLKPELVVEVRYDHFTSGRFRHGAHLLRWRPDKAPQQCTLDQVVKRGKSFKLLESA